MHNLFGVVIASIILECLVDHFSALRPYLVSDLKSFSCDTKCNIFRRSSDLVELLDSVLELWRDWGALLVLFCSLLESLHFLLDLPLGECGP